MNKKNMVLLYLKGLAMGAADVVPGVSGGTVAFITGIYDELLNSIKSVNPQAAKILLRQGLKAFWFHINGTFLITLIAGIATSFLLLAHAITWLMAQQPLLFWAFIFGLITASCVHVGKMLEGLSWRTVLFFLLGAVLVLAVTEMKPVDIQLTYGVAFIAGSIAICAMILPGISGSFMLLMMGLYGPMMLAIKGLDVPMIASFMFGCITGILLFAHIVSFCLERFRQLTLAFLTGMLFASLNAVWPWRVIAETVQIADKVKPVLEKNVLPTQYELLIGQDSLVVYCVLLAFIGFSLVMALEQLSNE